MQKKLLYLLILLLMLSISLFWFWMDKYQNTLVPKSVTTSSIPKADFYQKNGNIYAETEKGCKALVDGKIIPSDIGGGDTHSITVKRENFEGEQIQVEVVCEDGRHETIIVKTQYTENDGVLDYQLEDIRYHAIIIGISNYQKLDKLNTPVNDAKDIAEVLKNQYGFNITLLLDKQANRENILNTIQKLSDQLQKKDALLVYYAGHGKSEKNTKSYYWQPVNSDPKMRTQWIPAIEISNRIADSKSSSILVISDSCFAGAWVRTKGSKTSSLPPYQSMLIKKHIKISRSLLASGGDEPVEDGNTENSVFAKSLLDVLENTKKKAFTANYLYSKLSSPVVINTVAHQTPLYQPIIAALDKGGDFVFVKKEKISTLDNRSVHNFLDKLKKAITQYKQQTEDLTSLPNGETVKPVIVPNIVKRESVKPVIVPNIVKRESIKIETTKEQEEELQKTKQSAQSDPSIRKKKQDRKLTNQEASYIRYYGRKPILNNGVFVLAMGANTNGLKQANADAQRFAVTIKNKLNINPRNVVVMKNVTKESFEDVMDFLSKNYYPKVVVYFSGHGAIINARYRKIEGGCFDDAFVFSHDDALIFSNIKYRDDYFVNQLNTIKTVKLITILDTCFSGDMEMSCSGAKPKGMNKVTHVSSCDKSTTRIKKLKGLVLTASQENQMAWEYPSQGGRFTNALLYYINKADLSKGDAFRSAFRSARAKIIHETKGTGCEQRPQLFEP